MSTREIDYIAGPLQIDCYESQHRPENQTHIQDGVCINPQLREYFDTTPNEEREDLEISDWWDRPYIQTTTWAQMPPLNGTPEEIEAKHAKWLESFPNGTRYDVRCLDGGAWDRSTWWGTTTTLEAALDIAHNGPERWRTR